MSNFFKNKYRLLAVIGAFMLAITVLTVTIAQNNLLGDLFGDKEVSPSSVSSNTPDPSSEEGFLPIVDDDPEEDLQELDPSEEPDQPEPPLQPVSFHVPGNMRGAFLTPGVEFLTNEEDSPETIKAQINSALDSAKEMTLNTILINTNYGDKVIYTTPDSDTFQLDFDPMAYIIEQSRKRDLYVYGVLDLSKYPVGTSSTALSAGSGGIDRLVTNAGEFAETYQLDGILLDGYQIETTEQSYPSYAKLGGAIGFQNYQRQTPEAMVSSASKGIREKAPATQVGLLADPVWANIADNEEGSQTVASYTSLESGNADTKAFVEQGQVDFVAVKAFGSLTDGAAPFSQVVSWWVDVAKENDTPLYILQAASKAGGGDSGWGGSDQLVKQAIQLDETSGIRGNAFDSLAKLNANPSGSTTNLMKYYREEVEPEFILTQLEMTKPTQTTYTTNETQVVFTGATDPTEPVTINDEKITTDQSGYFTVTYPLAAGANSFVIQHKDRTLTYSITRQVNILTEIGPTGSIIADGGMEIRIVAVAYEGATVTASVGGSTIPLTLDEDVVDESSRDSSYKTYSGVYTAPAATASVQNLGAITVTAGWNSETKSLTGASITVNKKAKIEDGVPVVVIASQAQTFPANTLDNTPRADCYPLPKGAMDYAVGEEIIYKGVSYTVLASGLRVKSTDITPSSDFASGNNVSALSVETKDGFTYVTLKTSQKVSYNFGYAHSGLSITLNNTTTVPSNASLSKNPLFSAANWNGSTLSLSFVKTGGFLGYKGYYDDSGNLVFRFNNTPAGMSGTRVVLDPGHGGGDTGALGFLADYPERAINWYIAQATATELERRGATVLLLDNTGGTDLSTRVAQAETFNADFFVSIHNNTAPNAAAQGTEVYYFYPYSYPLAYASSSGVSSQLGTTNRGAKASYYHVTLSSQFSSVLVECGFMSNKEEYEKLIRTKYHERIAVGIADGISGAIGSSYTGVNNSGSENTGGEVPVGESSVDTSPNTAAGVTLNKTNVTLRVGSSATLKATVTPTGSEQYVTWGSNDTDIVTVDQNGTIQGIGLGTATITVTSEEGDKATCLVSVVDSGESLSSSSSSSSSSASSSGSGNGAPVTEIYISHNSANIAVGKTYQLDAEVYPGDAGNTAVSWSSSDTTIATVDSKGLVTAHKAGSVTITASSHNGKKAVSNIVVGASGDANALKDAFDITLELPQTTMYVNATQTAKVITDLNKTVPNAQLIWESSDKSIATIDSNGVITAKRKEGTTYIAVRNKEDTLFDSVVLTVSKQKVTITAVSLNYAELVVEKGGTNKLLVATTTPSNATHADLEWRTSNPKIATVDSNGVVTGVNRGNTTLIVKNRVSSVQTTCKIEVVNQVEIEDLVLDTNQLELWVGGEDYLVAELYPLTLPNKGVTWTSSKPSVVTVDSKGNIVAKAKGKATITATSVDDPTYKDSCEITVVE